MSNVTNAMDGRNENAEAAADATLGKRGCMFCGSRNLQSVVDLGMSPLCESYVSIDKLNAMEPFYPLHVFVCRDCFLMQLDEYVTPSEIFEEYAYFSSYSDSWVSHMQRYAGEITDRLGLGPDSLVIEVGSNDGYLLQHFQALGVPVLGIDPAANVAKAAVQRGIPTWVRFFGVETATELANQHKHADLIAGANVMAQVPDVNDFVEGLRIALAPSGVITVEFPHLMRLIEGNQFDTVYHEHFSYFSLYSAERIFAAHRLRIFDVEELDTHGGSLRIYACHPEYQGFAETDRLKQLRLRESQAGIGEPGYYQQFAERVRETKRKLLEFMIRTKRAGQSIAGYGAPGKGNTLLNYCGIRTDFIDFTVDRNPYKQGKFLPGTHIPIYDPDRISETRPDYVLILPWNLRKEISEQLGYIRNWGGKLVVPIPEVEVF